MVDQIKAAVDRACKSPVVSCADILAIAARDSVAIVSASSKNYLLLLHFSSIVNNDGYDGWHSGWTPLRSADTH